MAKKPLKKQDGNVSFDAFFSNAGNRPAENPASKPKPSGGSSSPVENIRAEKTAVQATVLEQEPRLETQEELIDHVDDAGSTPAPPISPPQPVLEDPSMSISGKIITFTINPVAPIKEPIAQPEAPVVREFETGEETITIQPELITWNFDETKKKQRILNDGLVYYCRACKRHFKGPVIVNNAITLDPFYNLKSCPLCGACEVHDVSNPTIEKHGTCERCGVRLGFDYEEKLTEDPVCLNCDRDMLDKLRKIKYSKKEKA
jgi:hypothetical protein